MGFFSKLRKKAKKSLRSVGLTKRNLKSVERIGRTALNTYGAIDPRVGAMMQGARTVSSLARPLIRPPSRSTRTARPQGLRAGTVLDTVGNILLSPTTAHAPTAPPRMTYPSVPSHAPSIPVAVTSGDPLNRPTIVQPSLTTRHLAPPGYVIVDYNGQKVGMLKEVARKAGLWKPQRKPPISAGDWRKLQVADRVRNKAFNIAKKADLYVTKSKPRARSRAACK